MGEMKKPVAVIGAGAMGSGIAQFLAQSDVNVLIYDQNPDVLDNVKSKIKNELQSLKRFGLVSAAQTDRVLDRISVTQDLEQTMNAWLVIEAIPEVLEWKQQLFQKVENLAGHDTIFATNTSGISITKIGYALKHPERLAGAHFFMPATVIPLVEIIKGNKTADETVEKVLNFFKGIGKKPVLVKKDIPGFIGNRIQHAMAREAISLLESGVSTAEEIDTVVRWSLGVRLLFTGPLEQRDINGLDVHYDIASYLYHDLENRTEPSRLLAEKVKHHELGIKTGKGFYDWSTINTQAIQQDKNRLLLQLMEWLKEKT